MVVIIAGPTGVGKTKVSIEIAKHYQTEIISGDSMQVYKGLDIGTAKITPEEKQGIKHHMIDILNQDESFSVAIYQEKVRTLIDQMIQNKKLPLIVGGTGFYIKSVLHDFDFEGAQQDEAFEKQYQTYSNEALFDLLNQHDPKSTKSLHPNNRKRVLQALYRAMHGHKKSNLKSPDKRYDYCLIVLRMEKETLYQRINQRVDEMVSDGLVEEAQRIYHTPTSQTAQKAIGYKELFSYFDGEITLEEALQQIKRNTRRYAKRQYTYFKNQFNPHYISMDNKTVENAAREAMKIIDKHLRQAI